MLTEDKRQELIKECEDLWSKVNRDGAEDMLNYLKSSDFYTAPASTRYHGAYCGGLLEHSMNVYHLLELKIGPSAIQTWPSPDRAVILPEESIIIASILHDLCKVNFYSIEQKNQKTYDPVKIAAAEKWQIKHDNKGDYVWESVDYYSIDDHDEPQMDFLGHGEKSAIKASRKMRLTFTEWLMIRWHMGYTTEYSKDAWDQYSKAIKKYPAVLAIFEADMEATHILEKED